MLIGFYLLNSKNTSLIIDWIFVAPAQIFSEINFFKFLKKIFCKLKEEEIFNHIFYPILYILSQKQFHDLYYCADSYLVVLLKTLKFMISKIKLNLFDKWIHKIYELLLKDYLFPQDISCSICLNQKTRSKAISILEEIIKKNLYLALECLKVSINLVNMGFNFQYFSS